MWGTKKRPMESQSIGYLAGAGEAEGNWKLNSVDSVAAEW